MAIKEGRIKTLSPGIDPATECFVEVSATPIPAIIGPSLMFSRGGTIYTEDNIYPVCCVVGCLSADRKPQLN